MLEHEYAQQLEGVFDIRLDGTVATEPGEHLDTAQRVLRTKLVMAVEHHRAGGMANSSSVVTYLREAAFTALNRFVAIKMLEARELVQECVSQGDQSAGFKEFIGLAPGLAQLPDRGYRLYIESLFDELAIHLRVLFSRRDPGSLLWPRRACLTGLIATLNAPDLADVWAEDETIGWVYQYYNGEAERKAMRAESVAPRNSRELAVRNQFFTPRYVVEFLTDNTLGRLWYEMTQGQTRLKSLCRYLVRRPREIFLKHGESPPESTGASKTPSLKRLSKEELLREPVHIPHRAHKDPRDIKLLDPACGSMHFGLYAFDLFAVIYDEAWDIADSQDKTSEYTEAFAPFVRFAASFSDKAAFLREVPRLIIEHNIHGIDIDPRAMQIAGLSLWLRAQRAWHQVDVRPTDRARITRSNVVCAEPMPGDKDLLSEFVEKQFPPSARTAFSFLLNNIFDCMTIAGDAGSLLRIEHDILAIITHARAVAVSQSAPRQIPLFPSQESTDQPEFNLSGLNDDEFWGAAEQQLYHALGAFADQAGNGEGFQRSLFVDDAAQGIAFIDLCRRRYDVVVTNPPFGEFVETVKQYAEDRFNDSGEDIDAAFVARGHEFLGPNGKMGVIANRTQFFKGVLRRWRLRLFARKARLDVAVDLGYGVLDGAVVEAAAYILDLDANARIPSVYVRALDAVEKDRRLAEAIDNGMAQGRDSIVFIQQSDFFEEIPGKRLAYWITPTFARAFTSFPALEGYKGLARQGLASADNFRFLRLVWEVPCKSLFGSDSAAKRGRVWANFAKGGEYSPYFQDLHLVIKFHGGGTELEAFPGSVLRNPGFFFKEALTYSERTASGFSPRALPAGCIFDSKGPIVAARVRSDLPALLGVLMSRVWATFLEFFVAAGDSSVSGTAARQYTQSIVGSVPLAEFGEDEWRSVGEFATLAWECQYRKDLRNECSRYFVAPLPVGALDEIALSLQSLSEACIRETEELDLSILSASAAIETTVREAYALDQQTFSDIDREFGAHALTLPKKAVDRQEFSRLYEMDEDDLIAEVSSTSGRRRATTKRSYFADRRLELLSLHFGCSADVLVELRRRLELGWRREAYKIAEGAISYAVGCAFGRWDIRYATGERARPGVPNPFAPLSVCPPGMLRGKDGLPFSPEFGVRLRTDCHYALDVAWDGILVDDPEHPLDIERVVQAALGVLWGDRADAIERESCEALGVGSLREWFRHPLKFFDSHLKRYSKSRRFAPIYWPVSSPGGSYTVWLYFHRFSKETLYRAQELVQGKIDYEERKLAGMEMDLASEAAAKRRRLVAAQEDLVTEVLILRRELARVALLWDPDLNDGVILNCGPLWRMIHHKPWQKAVRAKWDGLIAGTYDWAHLAMHLWPERVVWKCAKDRSLAIAHDLQEVFWQRDSDGRWQPRKVDRAEVDELVKRRTSTAVRDALKGLLDASGTATEGLSRRKLGRATGTTERTASMRQKSTTKDPMASDRSSLAAGSGLLNEVKQAISANRDGASKADVIHATGITAAQWTRSIKALLADGTVTQIGERRGARYHLRRAGG